MNEIVGFKARNAANSPLFVSFATRKVVISDFRSTVHE